MSPESSTVDSIHTQLMMLRLQMPLEMRPYSNSLMINVKSFSVPVLIEVTYIHARNEDACEGPQVIHTAIESCPAPLALSLPLRYIDSTCRYTVKSALLWSLSSVLYSSLSHGVAHQLNWSCM